MTAGEKPIDRYVTLWGMVEPEYGQFVSACPQLGVVSCGDTIDEALNNLDDAIALYLDDLEETGDLDEVVHRAGVEIKRGHFESDDVTNVPVRPGQTVKIYQLQLPLAGAV